MYQQDSREGKGERRDQKRFRSRYGHTGVGATHIREASEQEVRRHLEKAKARRDRKRKLTSLPYSRRRKPGETES
tara:strand:- start:72 stop:296 length:225 start_codon:yes stop_codon:yes gene_type:complete